MKLRAGIVGCGLIGTKRAQHAADFEIAVCCDVQRDRAERLASLTPGSRVVEDWRAVVETPQLDAVFVATTHDLLAPISAAAAGAGKHVLVEKPAARCASELSPVVAEAERSGVCVRVGFNHRYHRAFRKAREIFDSGAMGEPMFIRGRYGHGGRTGYDREWRAQREISGGGEAIDQGVHLIDLARWFLGDFPAVEGFAGTYFWDMPVEDNAFFLLRTASDRVAQLHASWTEWKNTFSFEIYGRHAKLEIHGLGGSYGVERLAHYQMRPELGPPETVIYEYPMADDSWEQECSAFARDIREGRAGSPGIADAVAALRIVEAVYERSRR
jgi:predicted dehydrogenase